MSILISDVSPRVHYKAVVGQTVFQIPFEWIDSTDVKVYVNEVLMTPQDPPSVDYTYSLVPNPDQVNPASEVAGGWLTFGPPGRAQGDEVVIFRDIPVERVEDFPTTGLFPVKTLNDSFDAVTAMVQQAEVNVDQRALRMAKSDFVHPLRPIPNRIGRMEKVLGFDGDGQPVMYDPSTFTAVAREGIWIGDAPPEHPWLHGQLWWESDRGNLHIWFVDGDSGQWVQINYGAAGVAGIVLWGDITGKPDTFPPAPHTHAQSEIINLVNDLALKAALVHTHAQSDITGLVTALSGKAPLVHTHVIGDVTNLQIALDGKAPTAHTHTIADVTTLQAQLDTKSPIGHTHTVADVSGLQTGLDAKVAKAGDTMTGKLNLPAAVAGSAYLNLGIGTVDPTTPTEGDVWYRGGSLLFRASANTRGVLDNGTNQNVSGVKTFIVKPIMATPTTATASINLPHGVAPTAWTNGDMWTTTAGLYVRVNGATVGPLGTGGGGGIGEAPADSKTYGRNNLAWVEVAGGGGISDAPSNGQLYGRMNAAWTVVPAADWATITGKPATFPPDAHVHAYSTLTGIPATFAPSAHSHPQSEVTNLVTDLAGKAPTSHTHTTAQVTGLDAALALKAPLASPPLTGTPTAPTAAPGTNTTQLATTEFVTAASSAVSKAPVVHIYAATTSNIAIPAGATHFTIQAVAGGGAGGGCNGAGGGAGLACAAGGGGSSGLVTTNIASLAAAGSPATYNVTIGQGGAGVTAAAGENGTATVVTIGTMSMTVDPGNGGPVASVSAAVVAWLGGQGATTSTFSGGLSGMGHGDNGDVGISGPSSSTAGGGASSPWGRGGTSQRVATAQAQNGNAGSGYGSGGAGAVNYAASVNRYGGAGGNGRAQITFYFGMT